MSASLVVVGDIMVDVVAAATRALRHGSDTSAHISTHGGGGGANTAEWYCLEGGSVALVGRVGDDTLGHGALDELRKAGVEVRVVVDDRAPTGMCVVVVSPDGERTMLPDAGANSDLVPADLPDDLFRSGAHLHLSGYTLLNPGSRLAGLAALDLARLRRMTVSVDPSSSGPLADVGVERFLDWIDGVDLLLANEDEACSLGDSGDWRVAGDRLASRYANVVVKLGREGAAWFTRGAPPTLSPAVALSVVDTTGAGDAFAAGLLAAWAAGLDHASCLAEGNRRAGLAVSRPGARP